MDKQQTTIIIICIHLVGPKKKPDLLILIMHKQKTIRQLLCNFIGLYKGIAAKLF